MMNKPAPVDDPDGVCYAFPSISENQIPYGQRGMTLRDYFAGQALAGSLANEESTPSLTTPEVEAQWAYEIADAMLAERTKEPKAK